MSNECVTAPVLTSVTRAMSLASAVSMWKVLAGSATIATAPLPTSPFSTGRFASVPSALNRYGGR